MFLAPSSSDLRETRHFRADGPALESWHVALVSAIGHALGGRGHALGGGAEVSAIGQDVGLGFCSI